MQDTGRVELIESATIEKEIRLLRSSIESLRSEVVTLTNYLPQPERYWTVPEVAQRLGISSGAVRMRIARGSILTVNEDGMRLITDKELRRLLRCSKRPDGLNHPSA